ncbi:hypothetical protein TTHERM_00118709 (macronuclear) [Tetrahymena thermophila SB210]|uniref:Uncharacterized protein n=1 Tax=Tetrahymena thermophila (strain SB210) TaxID=312017 RepID=A4VEF2_TETTS|nr:hypothetical protein TTHERM_00118709 [Tetrahymena thermophila SB210]EDK31908.2 hypothetical protein TTHERM_00118709 [Tetrahymena thermophila SB210]|eukprot:XP_001471220.2 hypothetical protein TTHERM_00118709 [Tetrahymena thermophila SB210]
MKSFFKGLFKNTTSYLGSQKDENIQRILLKGNQKTQIIQKIEEMVFKAKFEPIPPQMEDICEKVHYQVMNDEPIRIDYLQKLLPNVNFKTYDEEQYNEWLRYKHNLDYNSSDIQIDKQKSPEDEKKINNMGKNQVIDSQEILKNYKNQRK